MGFHMKYLFLPEGHLKKYGKVEEIYLLGYNSPY
jgi:hypothetical protein